MKVLFLVGLGALFFAYFGDDNFDPASLQGARVLLTGASVGVGEELAYHYARLGSHLVLTAHTEALLQKGYGWCLIGRGGRSLKGQLRTDGPLRARRAGLPGAEPPRRCPSRHAGPQRPGDTLAHAAPDPNFPGSRLRPLDLGSAPGWCSPSSIRNSAPVLEPCPYTARPRPQALGSARAPSGLRFLLRPVTRSRHLQVNFLSYVQLTSSALPSLTDSKGSLVVVSSLLGRVPTSFSSPYSAAKFALDSFFGSLRRELDVQDVNVAITMCVLGLRDRASAAEGVRGVTRAKAAPGPKAALAVIRGSATRASGVFYPWRFHLLCLLRGWMPQPRAWFIRQELNITTPAAA
nr:hydroxysteroid 11-beta-dehydrogenase 1-like protein isoform X2 [Kogia breviceps]XP_058916781.1 hydroxysteroid 11-beta-dehydrogenase 1-like protein isoform X2 [Kogia breviceps]